MSKVYRPTIRINGKEIKGPRFKTKDAADKWYHSKREIKLLVNEGVSVPLDKTTTLNQYFYGVWFPLRQQEYTKATWGSDEQRFRDYVEPVLGNLKVSKINTLQIRDCLQRVTRVDGQSSATRDRVRSLLSKILGDSINESPPLRVDNPALNITFKEARVGKRKPAHISREKDVFKFLAAGSNIGIMPFTLAATFIMAGIRKSELIALTWECFDPDNKEIHVKARFVQAENEIHSGTKGGSVETRVVSIADSLVKILEKWHKQTDFDSDVDFIFHKEGDHIPPRDLAKIIERISKESGVKASPHALRHSYGRWFVANGGSLKALQTQLGHSSSSTTDLYSELAAEQVKKDRNRVSFGFSDDDGEHE